MKILFHYNYYIPLEKDVISLAGTYTVNLLNSKIMLLQCLFWQYIFCGLCPYQMNCALSWCQSSSEVPFIKCLISFDFEILIQHSYVLSIFNSYKEIYNMTYRTLQSIDLINMCNASFRRAGTTYLRSKTLNS